MEGSTVSIECLLKTASYPKLCVASYGDDSFLFRLQRQGQSALSVVCKRNQIQRMSCNDVPSGLPFCGCVSKNASYFRFLYQVAASYSASGTYICKVGRCDNAIFYYALTEEKKSCGTKLGKPLSLPSLSRQVSHTFVQRPFSDLLLLLSRFVVLLGCIVIVSRTCCSKRLSCLNLYPLLKLSLIHI